MKRSLIIIIIYICALNTNAQIGNGSFLISGSFDFSIGKNDFSTSDFKKINGAGGGISASYFFAEQVSIGFEFGAGYVKTIYNDRYSTIDFPYSNSKQTNFYLNSFLRYYFYSSEKFGIFAQLNDYVTSQTIKYENKNSLQYSDEIDVLLQIGIRPGFQYFINNKLSAEVKLVNIVQFELDNEVIKFNLNFNPLKIGFNGLYFTFNYHIF